ncbi:sugar ABC transporter permease [Phytoactinopolyspora alkaliphila]|uniref:Sugar ABC transporter permease n=1 Tax=Phytoactinopolyspora alkaliphila TaxID=1783498 RepID=A0A6N9YG95_9ACTN|nr:sugar ABC transporter permease [Phytoactinopolyspora alkaliphila]
MTTHVGSPPERETPSRPGGTSGASRPAPRFPRRTRLVRLGRFEIKAAPYVFIAPFFILFGIFGAFPIGYTVYASLFDWTLLAGNQGFIGLDNYTRLFGDALFWNSLRNTFGIFVMATVPQLVLALIIANLLNRQLRARTMFRMGILAPYTTSLVAVGIVFGFIFAERYGLARYLLDVIGVGEFNWRNERLPSWAAISAMVDWRWTGYNALIYLAAMQAIPRTLYEAAAIDGARPWRQFWTITVPLIKPSILFTVILSTIGGMQLFTEPLVFNYGRIQGGSGRESQTVAMYIYERTFSGTFNVGYGAAISLILFLVIILVALVNFTLVRRSIRTTEE